LLRCTRGCQVRHPVLRSVLGTDRPAHDSILDPREAQTEGPLTINALAEDMVMDRTTLGRNILPLERDGLIRIEATASDRRAKELHLTKAGEKRLQAALRGGRRRKRDLKPSSELSALRTCVSCCEPPP
jgi:hypothetical protein